MNRSFSALDPALEKILRIEFILPDHALAAPKAGRMIIIRSLYYISIM
jgi:hypothetical protein